MVFILERSVWIELIIWFDMDGGFYETELLICFGCFFYNGLVNESGIEWFLV